MKKILVIILRWLARMILWYHQPEIIGITGSVGKTSTKQAVATVLATKFDVRTNVHNYNNEIGVPLTIIGADSGGRNPLRWLGVMLKALAYSFLPLRYPQILVLEMGADRPGDIKYLTKLAPAHIGIVTMISDQPAHMEFFRDVDQLAQEKNIMYKHLHTSDWAVVNVDEPYSRAIMPSLKSQKLTIALKNSAADLQAVEINYTTDPTTTDGTIAGLRFKLRYQGNTVPCFIPNVVGIPPVYAVLCATAVGTIYGMNLVEITQAFQHYQAPHGRMNLIPAINQAVIIDDTYNSSPAAVRAALAVLAAMRTPGKRILCLGNMEELGSQAKRAHRAIGKIIAELEIDCLITLGEKAQWIAEAALDQGLPAEAIWSYTDQTELITQLQSVIAPHDIVLIKGSQSMRLEKVVKALMADPTQAPSLLVRQYGNWAKV